jgi:hypothetical protein
MAGEIDKNWFIDSHSRILKQLIGIHLLTQKISTNHDEIRDNSS